MVHLDVLQVFVGRLETGNTVIGLTLPQITTLILPLPGVTTLLLLVFTITASPLFLLFTTTLLLHILAIQLIAE
jgi:hypothetical protein